MLHIHRAERADRLADALAVELRPPLADPFEADVVAVPTRGVERWLAQRLSHFLGTSGDGGSVADGVCANVRFPSPSVVVTEALAAVEAAPEADPWEPDRLRWPLLEVIDESIGEPWCATLSGYLGAGEGRTHRRGRRLWAASHLAGLFATYGADRPDMVCQWAALGADDLPSDGYGAPLAPDLRWQVQLWQRLRQRIGSLSPAERLDPACERLGGQPDLAGLPQRLSVFGPTRLTRAEIRVLAALSRHRGVHLWLPHPSPALWAAVEPLARGAGVVQRDDDPTESLPRNPLLASFSRDSRELQLRLAAAGVPVAHHHHPSSHAAEAAPHLLGELQRAVRDDQPYPPVDQRTRVQVDDRSVTLHACHGPGRQVEVLREVLVGLLADDPTLEPRDVVVMCPDIEQYAPLISAAFGFEARVSDGGSGLHPGHRLRVRLADRSLRQTNPVLGVAASVLELADSRLTAGAVLDLASLAPVRRRFRFDDDDLGTLGAWLRDSGVRWGMHLEHRRAHGLELAPNTWQAGMDRLLLGAAMDDDGLRWVGLALPLDDVDSSDIELSGRFAEFLDRLRTVLEALTGTRPVAAWLAALETALDVLTDVAEDETWQAAQARRLLAEASAESAPSAAVPAAGTSSGGPVPLTLHDVRTLLGERLQGRPTRANFRTGELTMCSMVPMRSVPHRVVCLLGLDDGAFPRTGSTDGDDILAARPHVGERDARSEDRQLLLDALLAAGEKLVVLYTGADPRSNAPRAPAVPVAEIREAMDAVATAPDGGPVASHVLVRHPLQPFDDRNFAAGALSRDGPFSFDSQGYRGALRAAQPREPRPPFLAGPVPPQRPAAAAGSAGREKHIREPGAVPAAEVALDDLVAFLESPARAFVRDRLGVSLFREEDELPDELPVELDGLQRWGIGDRMLQAVLSGVDVPHATGAEWRRGALPAGPLGAAVLDEVTTEVRPLAGAAEPYLASPARAVDVAVLLSGTGAPASGVGGSGGARRLVGTVTVHGQVLLRVVYSRLAAKHRLRAWVHLLALSASDRSAAWTAVTVGRGPREPRVVALPAVERTRAVALLSELVGLYDRGMAEVLPMATRTSARYAEKRHAGMNADNALRAAKKVWEGGWNMPGERADPEQEQVYGADAPFEVLIGQPADNAGRPDSHPGAEERTRFEALARRLWAPVLAHETGVGR